MSDYISRDKLKKKKKYSFQTVFGAFPKSEWFYKYEDVESIPSADVRENVHGEWIEKAEDYYKAINKYGGGVDENTNYFTDDIACPKCLSKFSTIDNETERFNFCPNCGADMRGGKE